MNTIYRSWIVFLLFIFILDLSNSKASNKKEEINSSRNKLSANKLSSSFSNLEKLKKNSSKHKNAKLKDKIRFLKYIESTSSDTSSYLDIPISRYNKGSIDIDLVAAIHMADEEYYDKLNDILKGYDVVLYEGIKGDSVNKIYNKDHFFSKGTVFTKLLCEIRLESREDILDIVDSLRENVKEVDIEKLEKLSKSDNFDSLGEIGKIKLDNLLDKKSKKRKKSLEERGGVIGGGSLGMIFSFQQMMNDFLGLEFQKQGIDYLANNFVHADMTVDQFTEAQSDNNENFLKILLRMVEKENQLKDEGKISGDIGVGFLELIAILQEPDNKSMIKDILARQFQDFESIISGINGPDGSVLINKRNDVVIKKLNEVIHKGSKKIAIFYGAAHMPDIHDKLVNKLGYRYIGQEWLTAWNIK